MIDKAWKDIGRNQEEIPSMEKIGGEKTKVTEMMKGRERLA